MSNKKKSDDVFFENLRLVGSGFVLGCDGMEWVVNNYKTNNLKIKWLPPEDTSTHVYTIPTKISQLMFVKKIIFSSDWIQERVCHISFNVRGVTYYFSKIFGARKVNLFGNITYDEQTKRLAGTSYFYTNIYSASFKYEHIKNLEELPEIISKNEIWKEFQEKTAAYGTITFDRLNFAFYGMSEDQIQELYKETDDL